MGVSKNFVVKNGIEVATELIYGDFPSNKVGIGTTVPTRKLDVNGNFNVVEDARVGGIGTVEGKFGVGVGNTALYVDTGTERIGINTTIPGYNLDVGGDVGVSSHLKVGGITTSYGLNVEGDSNLNDLKVTGVSTITNVRIEAGFTTVTYSEAEFLNVTGVATFAQLDVTNLDVLGIATVNNMYVTGISTHADNVKAGFGSDNDLEIYHDGSNSYIDDNGTGDLILRGSVVRVGGSGTTEDMIVATQNGSVGLYFDDSLKLETTSDGINVTGTTESDQLVVTGVTTLGIVTDVTSLGVDGQVYATQYIGDGSLLTGIDTSGNFQGKTVVAENIYLPDGPGIGIVTAGSVVINNPSGRITATEYYGDGSNLTNTGAELNPASGTQRLVLTGLTTDRMVSAATTSTLAYNVVTDTLSSTNFSASSDVSATNVSASSSVTAASFYGDGANLTNTGSTLSAASGTERVVFTNLTSGTMTASSTDADVTFNATSSQFLLGTNKIILDASTGTGTFGSGTVTLAQGTGITVEDGAIDLYQATTNNGAKPFKLQSDVGGTKLEQFYIQANGDSYFRGGVSASSFSGTLSGGDITAGSIPNSALENSTISGKALGSNLSTLTRGSYLTGSNYNGSTGRTWAVDATSSNTASKVVARDSSGNFSAGTITATLSGTATNATNTRVDTENSTNATRHIVFSDGGDGANRRMKIDGNMYYNPSTNTLTVSNLSGNASTATNATNAGTLDGYDSSVSATASTVVVRDGSGHINANYFQGTWLKATHGGDDVNSVSYFPGVSSDGWYYHLNQGNMRTALNVPTRTGGNASGTWGINITGNSSYSTTSGTSSSCSGNAATSSYASTVLISYNNDSNSTYQMLWGSGNSVYGTGNIYCNPYTDTLYASNFNSISDIRVKDNIKTLKGSLSKLQEIRGVEYDRNDKESRPHQLGVIAQEVEKVFPDVVNTDEEGMKSVTYQQLIPVLIEAVKELSQEVDQLKKQINN